jgi:Mycothiol maleylpyruvate isomerase N-terminal domain
MVAQPVVDRASFYISVSDRSKVSPVIYQYIVDHAQGHTPATILDQVGQTFAQALEAVRTTPPDTIGPGFFGLMRLDEVVATRLVETQVHGMDLTDALGAPPLHMPTITTIAAEVLDEVLARRAVPGRPADLEGPTWRSSGPPLGAASTPILASPSWDTTRRPPRSRDGSVAAGQVSFVSAFTRQRSSAPRGRVQLGHELGTEGRLVLGAAHPLGQLPTRPSPDRELAVVEATTTGPGWPADPRAGAGGVDCPLADGLGLPAGMPRPCR